MTAERLMTDALTKTTSSVLPRKTFSLSARVTSISLAGLIASWAVYTSLVAPWLLPVIVLPTIWMFSYHSSLSPSQRGSSERLLWIYLGAAIPGILIVMIFQGILLVPFVSLVFGSDKDFFWHEFGAVKKESDIRDDSHRAARAEFTATPSYWTFVLFMSFVLASGLEETLKYTMIMIGKGKGRLVHGKERIMYGAAAGLGFATLENIAWIIPACQSEDGGKLLLTVVERMGLGVPLHTVAGMLTGVGVVQRDLKGEQLGLLSIVGPSIFFHGLFDFVLFGYSAWSGHVGWVHPEDVTGIAVLLVATVAVGIATTLTLYGRMAKLGLDNSVATEAKS